MSSEGMDGRRIRVNHVYLGDSKDYMGKFPPDSVDMIVLATFAKGYRRILKIRKVVCGR